MNIAFNEKVSDTEKTTASKDLRHIELVARLEIAKKTGLLLQKATNGHDRDYALHLARLLIEDTSISVREALSLNLKKCRFLPKDLVLRLSRDIDQVSIPFVMASDALTDADMKDIISTGSLGVQEAIAARRFLSEIVSFAICDTAGACAVVALMQNKTACLSLGSFRRTLERFPEKKSLLEIMVRRSDLSGEIVERLIFKVSANYGRYLIEKFGLAADYSAYIMGITENNVFNASLEAAHQSEVSRYMNYLYKAGGLKSNLLLQYLQQGHLRLFFSALAIVLGKTFKAIDRALSGGNEALLARLLNRIELSKSVSGAMVIAYRRHFRH